MLRLCAILFGFIEVGEPEVGEPSPNETQQTPHYQSTWRFFPRFPFTYGNSFC